MEIWRLRSFGHFLLSIPFVGTRSSTNGISTGFTSSGMQSNWRWSYPVHRKVTLDGNAQSWDL